MGSSRAEEHSAGINSQGFDDIEAGKQETGHGTSLAGEKQPPFVDPGDVTAAPTLPGRPQRGAGLLPYDEPDDEWGARELQDAVFRPIERDLENHDELQRLLANEYRDSEKKPYKEVARKARERLGMTDDSPVESDRDTDDDDSCYIEIKNLVFIDNSVIHKKALKEWDRKEKLFASRLELKSTEVGSLKNEVYQLIFFSVFQGVVVTATSQTNLLTCSSRWSTILLSLLASIVIIAGVIHKLMKISSLEKTINSEEQALKDVVHRGQDLRRKGKDFVFAKFSRRKKKGLNVRYSTWDAVGVVSFILVFAVVFPLSQWRILCSGRNAYGGAPPPA